VQLIGALEIGAAEQLELLFDWDVRSGLVHPPGRGAYHLKPVIRVIGVSYRSKLSGTIALATLQDAANDCNADSPDEMDLGYGNAVYIFEGYDVTPDDVDLVDDVAPIQTVDAEANAAGDYEYSTILGEGLYTVAFTCQAGNDGSETNETGTEPPETDTVAFFATTHNIEVNGSTADLEADF
jgi:hypothetical protein